MQAMVLHDNAGIESQPLHLMVFPDPELGPGEVERGGTLAIAGIYLTPVAELNYERHLFYERTICSVTAIRALTGQALLKEAAMVPIRPHTVTYPLADANRALLDLKKNASTVRDAADRSFIASVT